MKKMLFILLLFIFLPTIYSYENDIFSVDIPNDYNEKIDNNIYTWSKENDYINITINDNINDYDVRKFSQSDIDKQKEYIINNYEEKLSNYKVIPTITNMNLINEKNNSYLEYDLLFESKNIIGHNIYQKCRFYTSKNYVYLITLNSESEISNDEINILNSFKVKDDYLVTVDYKLYISLFVIFCILILLFNYYINKKRH